MVGRRHDRAFCACGGEERGGREEERERESEREREREDFSSSSSASSVHEAAASVSFGQLRRWNQLHLRIKTEIKKNVKYTHSLIHMQMATYSSMLLHLQLNQCVTVTSHDERRTNMRGGNPRRGRFSGRSSGHSLRTWRLLTTGPEAGLKFVDCACLSSSWPKKHTKK